MGQTRLRTSGLYNIIRCSLVCAVCQTSEGRYMKYNAPHTFWNSTSATSWRMKQVSAWGDAGNNVCEIKMKGRAPAEGRSKHVCSCAVTHAGQSCCHLIAPCENNCTMMKLSGCGCGRC